MSKELTVNEVSTQVKSWAPGLKDFALVDFNQQNFFKTAILAISDTPTLMECMQTPSGRESVYNAMKRAFSTGLSLNPQEGKAAIIAYKGKASYQIMKEGAIEIVMRTGDVKTLCVDIVYENDFFKIKKTNAGDEYEYSPARRNRGNVDGYFCAILNKEGKTYVKWMTVEECLEIRDSSSSMWKFKKEKSPWFNNEKGMCKKTVIKAAIRDLHISPSAKSQFSAEDVSEFEDNAPEFKDVTPEKKTGSTQADVTKKLTTKADPAPDPKQEQPEKSSGDDRF